MTPPKGDDEVVEDYTHIRMELQRLYDELRDETDRGFVLVVAAKIEELLRKLIDKRLRPPSGVPQATIDVSRIPVSALAEWLYRLGIIPCPAVRLISAIIQLRHRSAHTHLKFSLEDVNSKHYEIVQSIAGKDQFWENVFLCFDLISIVPTTEGWFDKVFGSHPSETEVRNNARIVLLFMILALEGMLVNVKELGSVADEAQRQGVE